MTIRYTLLAAVLLNYTAAVAQSTTPMYQPSSFLLEWEETIPPRLDLAADCFDGMSVIIAEDGEGLINMSGEILIEPVYDHIHKADGYNIYSVHNPKANGLYFPLTGKFIEPEYSQYSIIGEGVAPYFDGSRYGLLDESGKVIIRPVFDVIIGQSDGLLSASMNKLYGCIDQSGNWVIDPVFNYVGKFSEGLAPAKDTNKRWGYINKKGDWVIKPFTYNQCEPFQNGIAKVLNQSNPAFSGFINSSGEWLLEYGEAEATQKEGIVFYTKDKKLGWVSSDGTVNVEPQFENTHYLAARFSEGLIALGLAGKKGFANENGKWVIPPVYELALSFSDGLAAVRKDNLYGYIDQKGNQVIPFQFKSSGSFYMGLASIRMPNEDVLINKKGEIIRKYSPNAIYTGKNGKYITFCDILNLNPVTRPLRTDLHPYRHAEGYNEGYLRFSKDGKFGFLTNAATYAPEPAPAIFWKGFTAGDTITFSDAEYRLELLIATTETSSVTVTLDNAVIDNGLFINPEKNVPYQLYNPVILKELVTTKPAVLRVVAKNKYGEADSYICLKRYVN